jgi:hypothetical protein
MTGVERRWLSALTVGGLEASSGYPEAMHQAVYRLFDQACPVILVWLMAFLALTVGALLWRAWTGRDDRHRDSMIGGELPGILLVLMHSVCFGYSLYLRDWLSALVFLWWGPGFLVIAILVLLRRPVPWRRLARATSVACKLLYLVLVALFLHYGYLAPVFAYSLWIMHDQVRLAWLQRNADRTRRLTEDWWFPRIAYPAFLAIPFFSSQIPWHGACVVAASIIYVLWLWGLGRLITWRTFFRRPESCTDNLRDIVYLTDLPAPGTQAASP